MTASTQRAAPGPIRVRLLATKPDDYTEVSLHLPAEAVDESGGIQPAVLLRHLADDLDLGRVP